MAGFFHFEQRGVLRLSDKKVPVYSSVDGYTHFAQQMACKPEADIPPKYPSPFQHLPGASSPLSVPMHGSDLCQKQD